MITRLGILLVFQQVPHARGRVVKYFVLGLFHNVTLCESVAFSARFVLVEVPNPFQKHNPADKTSSTGCSRLSGQQGVFAVRLSVASHYGSSVKLSRPCICIVSHKSAPSVV
jgi:hypothetical protein